jgi:hypothetical protein
VSNGNVRYRSLTAAQYEALASLTTSVSTERIMGLRAWRFITLLGLRFWVYVTTVPLTLLTFASLVVACWTQHAVRRWWLGAAAAALVARVMTFVYFIPTMLKLMANETLPKSEPVATAVQWVHLGYVRHAAILVAWLTALKAFSLMSKNGC